MSPFPPFPIFPIFSLMAKVSKADKYAAKPSLFYSPVKISIYVVSSSGSARKGAKRKKKGKETLKAQETPESFSHAHSDPAHFEKQTKIFHCPTSSGANE